MWFSKWPKLHHFSTWCTLFQLWREEDNMHSFRECLSFSYWSVWSPNIYYYQTYLEVFVFWKVHFMKSGKNWQSSLEFLQRFYLQTSVKRSPNNPGLCSGCCSLVLSPLTGPPSLRLHVCGMWFGFPPKDYSERENKAPQCALFSAFLSPDISPLQEGHSLQREWVAVCGKGPPWPQQSGWRTPTHKSRRSPPTTIQSKRFHVVLLYKLDGDARWLLRWITPSHHHRPPVWGLMEM